MSIYDNFADSPNQIKIEGQEITIKFQRTGNNSARISWNIPPPAHGCSAENRAYDGIVVTVSNSPANYLSTSPKDGTYYDADPTADFDVHVGSVLDGAYVVGAFYHDKTTTFIDIDGIKDRTPYYVSGYAVDGVGRYHREGVHAYSIPTGTQSFATVNYPAIHEIQLYSAIPLTTKSPTGLLANETYTLPIKVECMRENFTVNGYDAVTYGALVEALNKQFSMYNTSYRAPLPPHAGHYLKDGSSFYQWNGFTLAPVSVVSLAYDPVTPQDMTYWYNNTSGVLQVYISGSWQPIAQIIESTSEPTELSSYTIWFDGTTVRVWENGHWCDYVTVISDTNPQLIPQFQVGTYWFDEAHNEMFSWNEMLKKWEDSLVIYYDTDPNLLNTGDFWYDEKNDKMKRFVASNWNTVTGVKYVAADASGNFPDDSNIIVVADMYWFDTLNHKFYQRNLMNTEWDEINFVSYPTNPRQRKSCDLWWNSSPSVDDLFVWEQVTSTWVAVDTFIRSRSDPNTPPLLDENTAWVKPDGTIILINDTTCDALDVIQSETNPREIVDGMIWRNASGNFFVYSGGEWLPIENLVVSTSDPFIVIDGYLWFNKITEKLYRYTSGNWVEHIIHLNRGFLPKLSDQWFNTVDDILMEWNGITWVPGTPFIFVEFVKRTCSDNYEKLIFKTKKTGCHESFEVMDNGNTLLGSLVNSVIYMDPQDGSDGVDAGPMYQQLGVGDDGSPDERRSLHEQIRMAFGSPSTKVEITKQQLDNCIDNALLVLRKYSSYSYKKAMFFLDLKRNQQVYVLSNKCVGFNKIVEILALHRVKAGAFRAAYSRNDNFAYAALQQLYTLGTFDILTFHLTASYVEELETLFASRIMYNWYERKRELKIYQVPRGREKVLVEAIIERTEQELLSDRETAYWLRKWAIMEAKSMLAQVRGKYATLPGPNGTTTLNANELQTQLEQERTELLEELKSFDMQDLVGIGMKAHVVIG